MHPVVNAVKHGEFHVVLEEGHNFTFEADLKEVASYFLNNNRIDHYNWKLVKSEIDNERRIAYVVMKKQT